MAVLQSITNHVSLWLKLPRYFDLVPFKCSRDRLCKWRLDMFVLYKEALYSRFLTLLGYENVNWPP